jgi:hypothetical protein
MHSSINSAAPVDPATKPVSTHGRAVEIGVVLDGLTRLLARQLVGEIIRPTPRPEPTP